METPNIDALAKKGVKFWQAYSPAPTWAPTRCAILSGIHPARFKDTCCCEHLRLPPSPPDNDVTLVQWPHAEDTYTIARALSDAGYVTGHSGNGMSQSITTPSLLPQDVDSIGHDTISVSVVP